MVFAFSVTLHVTVLDVVQPVQEEKVFPLAVEGAVRMICVPELAVTVKPVEPFRAALLPFSVYEIETPVEGLAELTVSVYVTGGGVELPPLVLPQDAAARHSPAAAHNAISLPKQFIAISL